MGELAPTYDDCPQECPDSGEEGPCETCPRKEIEDGFREDTIGYLNERARGWERYGFDLLYGDVISVSHLATLDEKELTVPAARCVSILKNEREKMRRIDEWNRKQKAK